MAQAACLKSPKSRVLQRQSEALLKALQNFSTKFAVPTGEGSCSFSPLRFTLLALINSGKVDLTIRSILYFREQSGFIELLVLSLAFVKEKKYVSMFRTKMIAL